MSNPDNALLGASLRVNNNNVGVSASGGLFLNSNIIPPSPCKSPAPQQPPPLSPNLTPQQITASTQKKSSNVSIGISSGTQVPALGGQGQPAVAAMMTQLAELSQALMRLAERKGFLFVILNRHIHTEYLSREYALVEKEELEVCRLLEQV